MNTEVKCSIKEVASNEPLYQIEVHNSLPAYIVKKHDGLIPYIHSIASFLSALVASRLCDLQLDPHMELQLAELEQLLWDAQKF